MRTTRWSDAAKKAFNRWLFDFVENDEARARQAADVIEERAARLAAQPHLGRTSRWEGLRELSLTRWCKLLVYQVRDEEVVIIAFYDTRRDLSALSPKPE